MVLDRLEYWSALIEYRWATYISKGENHTVLHRLRRDSAPYSDGESQ